eukprot:COSAG01_NODE_9872_length_2315_cov_1.611011_4_plen_66_part_00
MILSDEGGVRLGEQIEREFNATVHNFGLLEKALKTILGAFFIIIVSFLCAVYYAINVPTPLKNHE